MSAFARGPQQSGLNAQHQNVRESKSVLTLKKTPRQDIYFTSVEVDSIFEWVDFLNNWRGLESERNINKGFLIFLEAVDGDGLRLLARRSKHNCKKPLTSHTLSLSTRRNCLTGAYVLKGDTDSEWLHTFNQHFEQLLPPPQNPLDDWQVQARQRCPPFVGKRECVCVH